MFLLLLLCLLAGPCTLPAEPITSWPAVVYSLTHHLCFLLFLNILLFLYVLKHFVTCTMSSRVAEVNINISLTAGTLVGAHCVGTVCQGGALMESRLCTLIYICKQKKRHEEINVKLKCFTVIKTFQAHFKAQKMFSSIYIIIFSLRPLKRHEDMSGLH